MRVSDVIVVGGGIAGISAAAELARDFSVIVLEGEAHCGYHSTGRSAATFILNYGNSALRQLNKVAYPMLAGSLTGESFLSPRGEMLVANRSSIAEFENYLEGADGLEMLTAEEACKLVPVLRREEIAMAAIEKNAFDIDVDRLLQTYSQAFRKRGGKISTASHVVNIKRRGKAWQVSTPTGTYSAGIIVNAAGAWADEIAILAGVPPVGLQPMRRSAVIMPMADDIEGWKQWPLFACAAEGWYARPEATGLMISPADEDPVSPQDVMPDDIVIAEGLHRFEQMVHLPIRRPTHSWAGLRSFVFDRSPVCGFDLAAPGFFWLAGQGGYGVQTSPAMAELAASLCRGEAPATPALVQQLSPNRPGINGRPKP